MQTDDTYVSSLNRIFQDNFSQTFGAVRKKGKKDSLIYASSLYRRWYYSAMVENTFFSPALMTDALCAKPGSVAATAIFPKADSAEASFTFKTYEYSADSHPVIDDLKRIMEFCVPDSDKLGDALRSGGAPMRSVLSRLSIWDPFYVEFLASIATHLGLVEQFPSIHTKKLQVSHKKYDHFFAQSPQEMFMQIVESTVKFVAAFFHETMFPFSGMFTESRIRAMLSEPINAGELYEYVFESSEIPDMLGILDNDILENAFVSESILVGLLYDKCFLCTFGYYLKLIHPIYTAVYDFDTEIKEFLESAGDNSSMLASLYLPAQHYVATKLGQEVFSAPESRESLFTDRGNVESALKIILNGGGAAELEKLYGKAC
ncbi:MAG: hypothetical protein FWF44_00975, partial [Defluviitaleaceae bacterium]|nr:hypothetical protein [Defluviitaleaceae bacterium]